MVSNHSSRIPIITVGGFLGAGKTTLVNQVLAEDLGKRIVVFVNDFGEINIDHALIETVEEDKISLKNGCVCCTLNDDLIAQVMEYANSDNRPDCFIIEASGVADPRVLDASINKLEQVGGVIADIRVYVVDAENFHLSSYDDTEMIIDHAASSDLIVINKIDRLAEKQLQNLKSTLNVAAPYNTMIETTYCEIGTPLQLLTMKGMENRSLRADASIKKIRRLEKSQFSECSTVSDSALDRQKFEQFVKGLPDLCWRAKGILKFSDDESNRYVFHFVGQRASLEKLSTAETIPMHSQFVAIAKTVSFQPQVIEAKFLDSVAT